MTGRRWIQPPKLAAVSAAVGIGLFLSISSHAFNWSQGSTFAVACALIGVLAFFGPALFLMNEGDGERSAVSSVASVEMGILKKQIDQAMPATLYSLPLSPGDKSFNSYRYSSRLDYGAHTNRLEDAIYRATARPADPYMTSPSLREIGADLSSFAAMAGMRDRSLDLANSGILKAPWEVALVGHD